MGEVLLCWGSVPGSIKASFLVGGLVLTSCQSGGSSTTGTSGGGGTTAGAGSSSSSGGSSSGGGTGSTTGSGGPELIFDLDPVSLTADAGLSKQLAVSSLLNEPVSSKITFVFVPDAGVCQGVIEGAIGSGGRNFLLFCDANDAGGYLLSLSANQAGTIITGQSIRNDEGQVICGSLHFGCQTDSDCCIGFDCQSIDAGPTIGELRRCGYAWPD